MTIPHTYQAARKPASLKRLLVGTTVLPAAAFGLMLAFVPGASATDIQYQYSAGATVTFADGNEEQISGTIEYNPIGNSVGAMELKLIGPSPESGTYDILELAGPTYLFAGNTSSTDSVTIQFQHSLALGTDDPITRLECVDCLIDGGDSFPVNQSGSADPVIPEPSSLALLGAALGLFGLRRRAFRRR